MEPLAQRTDRDTKTVQRPKAASLVSEALDELFQALKAGKSEGLLRMLACAGVFHHYSLGNQILIARQRPEARQVAGFRAWLKLGRCVKKDERGIKIIVPLRLKKKKEEEEQMRFKVAHVFDVSQTDGEDLPTTARTSGDPGVYLDRLYVFAASQGITVQREDLRSRGAYGLSKIGTIVLDERLSGAEEFSVLAHELAHELMHTREERKTLTEPVRETEADAVAFAVGHGIGLEGLTASADYIQLSDGTTETLKASLGRIRATASRILEALASNEMEKDTTPETAFH